jgi:N-acetylglucosaminyl-diphospho-decaprenol L-rhamnosyltransferase
MTPELSAIVVTHRSAPEAAECISSLRRAFREEGTSGEILLVDCGSGPEEAERLRVLPADRHVLLVENRGYSGGLNAGLAAARADTLLLCNADVVFHSGALAPLLRALGDRRIGAAAPLSLWDAEGRMKLPPGFSPGFFRDLAQLAAGRWPAFDDWRFARFAREAQGLWENGGRARHLSGAVLAARREVFDRAGRFDERFPFEYEETEWEDRVRSEGFDLLFVPEARVRHLWAVSASRSPETRNRRAASEALYRRSRYGRAGRAVLDRAARLTAPEPEGERIKRETPPRFAARAGAAVALSPNRSGLPFAAADLAEEFRLPQEICDGLSPGTWLFTIFRKVDGRPLERLFWRKGA